MFFSDKNTVERVRKQFPPGTRVRLVRMDDPYTSLKPGATGTVRHTDDTATVHIRWDEGVTLGAVYGVDEIQKLKEVEL